MKPNRAIQGFRLMWDSLDMEDNGYFIKTLFRKFAFPTVMALLGSTISTLINSIMAGAYFGGNGLTVLGICSPVFFLFATLGALIGAGSANVASKYMSDDNFTEVNRFYSTALLLIIVTGAFVSIVGIAFDNNIVSLLGGNAGQGVIGYYRNYVPFGMFTMLIYIPMNFTRIDGNPKVGLYMFLAMAASNMLANYVLINFFKIGIEAIALGTAVGAFGACITGFIFLRKKNSHIRFHWPSIARMRNKLPSILIAGSPMALNNLFSLVKILVLNGLVISLNSSSSLAVISVLWTLNTFAVAILSGLGQAIVPIIGVFNEEKDNSSIRQVIKFALTTGFTIFLSLCLFLVLFWEQTFMLFGLTGLGQNGQMAMLFFALSLMVAVINVILSFYFTGTGKIFIANIITISRGVLFILPIAYLLSFISGSTGVWLSFISAEVCTLVLSLICVRICCKADSKLSFPLLMNKEYEEGKKYISFSVDTNTEAIAKGAIRVTEFCDVNELSGKQTMLISMSIEELLGLIMTHSINKLYHSIAIRILILEGTIIMRMRYIGEKFNPIDYYRTNISDDIEKSIDIIGIKYIVETAKTVDYRETFGINNLIIEL